MDRARADRLHTLVVSPLPTTVVLTAGSTSDLSGGASTHTNCGTPNASTSALANAAALGSCQRYVSAPGVHRTSTLPNLCVYPTARLVCNVKLNYLSLLVISDRLITSTTRSILVGYLRQSTQSVWSDSPSRSRHSLGEFSLGLAFQNTSY